MAVVVLLGALAPVAWGQPGSPVQVLTAAVAELALPEVMSVVGTIEPMRRSVVASEVSGLVDSLPVRQGDDLAQGQVLCTLDRTSRRLEHRQAQATLDALTERIAEAQALFDNWEREKQRIDRLREQAVASDKEYRDIATGYITARSRLTQAKLDVVAQQALVDRLADALAKTTIKAPFSGTVVALRTEVGQWLGEGSPVLEMIDLSAVLVRVDAPANVLPHVMVGQPCVVTVDALGRQFTGKIKHIIRQADPQARTLPIEVELVNDKGHLAAGMFARAEIASGPTRPQLIVSRDAVCQRGTMRMVYVVRSLGGAGALAEPLPCVLVGEHEAGVAIQAAGLKPGQQVVVRGNEQFLMGPPGPVPVIPTPLAASAGRAKTASTSQPASDPPANTR